MTQRPYGGHPGHTQQWPTPPPRKPRFGVVARVLMVVGAILLIAMVSRACASTTAPRAASAPAASQPTPTASAPVVPAQTEPAGIGDGTWIVGTDLQPGTYRSAGARQGFFELCTWSTKAGAASNAKTINFGTANANEPMVVEITGKVKAFVTSNCDPWVKVG